jgi:hypothetical protein
VTDLNPPDRLAEIKRHSTRYGFIDDDQSWLFGEVERLLGELVETRALAATLQGNLRLTIEDSQDAIDRAVAERDVERARADQLQADLDALKEARG